METPRPLGLRATCLRPQPIPFFPKKIILFVLAPPLDIKNAAGIGRGSEGLAYAVMRLRFGRPGAARSKKKKVAARPRRRAAIPGAIRGIAPIEEAFARLALIDYRAP